ncbi:MAG TPA: alginate lyase family protein [Anaerolineaceae bacterium]|nr:alginate lyase family protein [Anaerolineaceae bacterium]
MSNSDRISILLKSLRQLGLEQMGLYALYQLGLRSGQYRRSSSVQAPDSSVPASQDGRFDGPFSLPGPEELGALLGDDREDLLVEADEIVAGSVRIFGMTAPLDLAPPAPLRHWTEYERDKAHWSPAAGKDIKWFWEPARFGWVFALGRAYRLTGDERYPTAFWRHSDRFWQANPPGLGPNWASGQEVALRMLSLVFARQVFNGAASSPPGAMSRLGASIGEHARRIPLTLVYARSQNNNHLLSEAVGLYAAGVLLAGWPEADRWRRLGWKWLNLGFQRQIRVDGTYVQHSTNYHRMMLHLALWAHLLAQMEGVRLPEATLARLRAAVAWLEEQTDPNCGEMTNLGANDGAQILPLAQTGFRDARPTLQAASLVFCGQSVFPPGPWDEMAAWLGGQPRASAAPRPGAVEPASGARINMPGSSSWASIRAVTFHERPSHADQLHVELWWQGTNLARDAGTYLYNAPSPWDNRLAETDVHNTICVDGKDQMLRAGRFLWLDWAQARITRRDADPSGEWERIIAVHDGYHRMGIQHERTLARQGAFRWVVTDRLLDTGAAAGRHLVELHWLLPDWEWALGGGRLILKTSTGPVILSVTGEEAGQVEPGLQIIRAGVVLAGEKEGNLHRGWYSSTYGKKEPALSLVARVQTTLPVGLVSEWTLPGDPVGPT